MRFPGKISTGITLWTPQRYRATCVTLTGFTERHGVLFWCWGIVRVRSVWASHRAAAMPLPFLSRDQGLCLFQAIVLQVGLMLGPELAILSSTEAALQDASCLFWLCRADKLLGRLLLIKTYTSLQPPYIPLYIPIYSYISLCMNKYIHIHIWP